MDKTRVLVIDDEPKMVRLVREVLSAAGYDVITSCKGEQAVEMVAIEQPDLILLDIILYPGDLDGYGYDAAKNIADQGDVTGYHPDSLQRRHKRCEIDLPGLQVDLATHHQFHGGSLDDRFAHSNFALEQTALDFHKFIPESFLCQIGQLASEYFCEI